MAVKSPSSWSALWECGIVALLLAHHPRRALNLKQYYHLFRFCCQQPRNDQILPKSLVQPEWDVHEACVHSLAVSSSLGPHVFPKFSTALVDHANSCFLLVVSFYSYPALDLLRISPPVVFPCHLLIELHLFTLILSQSHTQGLCMLQIWLRVRDSGGFLH